ncbi:MAG: ABC transporter ATP-binding protein/permease [Gammaproteobacteria bacterium]|nr:ABC transporter ATP-binding protein/permease [Gammaproteobacteria bacterium]
MYILEVIKTLFRLLDRATKKKYILLQLFFLVSALVQVLGVASIAPFIGILSNPDIIQSNKVLVVVYEYYNFSSNTEFITAFAIASLALIVISNLLAGITMWLSFQFSIHFGNKLQNNLFHNLLGRDYIYHKVNDHSDAIALINQEAPRFVYMVLHPFLILTSQLFIAFIVLLGLIILDPFIASMAGLVVGGAYLVTYMLLKRSLSYHGKIVSERNTGVQSVLSEAFVGIKEIIIGSKEYTYKKKFEYYNRRGLVSQSSIALAGDLPKLIIETISFGAILLLAISLLLSKSDSAQIVSILSLYGLAGYKLLPAMQQVYKSLSSISANGAVVMKLGRELEYQVNIKSKKVLKYDEDLKSIELRGVSFTYPNSSMEALSSINAIFEKGCINVLAGLSGSGKSTAADITLGLLVPSIGEFIVNGSVMDQKKLTSYQSIIGYVPQNIFLTNESVLANVAFGIESSTINKEKVIRALELANAYEFSLKLPQGINTILGQDGKLLSGGQRQRIGIARALYHDTKVLVLDEPTSALDMHSEHEFMKCLHELKHEYLIVLISHSPSVIKMSDHIYVMDAGKLKANGSYGELIESSPDFFEMMNKAYSSLGENNSNQL